MNGVAFHEQTGWKVEAQGGKIYPLHHGGELCTGRDENRRVVVDLVADYALFVKIIEPNSVPEKVRQNDCSRCLWASCECTSGSKYVPKSPDHCQAYTYYD